MDGQWEDDVSTLENPALWQAVNMARYPLSQPDSAQLNSIVARTQYELRSLGCAVLLDFINPAQRELLRTQCATVTPRAYYDLETVNAYNIAVDKVLPDDHPGRILMQRQNAFVALDDIPEDFVIRQLYFSEEFKSFVARCFELPNLYELADPMTGLCLNIIKPGREHPWHFDTNEFTVSIVVQEPQDGGVSEYCPDIRSARSENFADVRAVLTGAGRHLVQRLSLRVGDLQLFRGRYALHRVTPVQGGTDRISAIFAYSEIRGVICSVARTRQLFGRVRPEHLTAEDRAGRVDQLLD
jgi:hypothetical protein